MHLNQTFCVSYSPTFLSFFHSLTCWQDIHFCHCGIVLKIGNYTAELKQILFNDYLYSVFPVASVLAVSLQLHPQCSCVVVLQRAVLQPQLFLSWLSSISLNKPTGPFPWTSLSVIFFMHLLRFSSPSSIAPLSSQRPGSCVLIED